MLFRRLHPRQRAGKSTGIRSPDVVVRQTRMGIACSKTTMLRAHMASRVMVEHLQPPPCQTDRKSTRLNSSHLGISYAVFCLKKKKKRTHTERHTSISEKHVSPYTTYTTA